MVRRIAGSVRIRRVSVAIEECVVRSVDVDGRKMKPVELRMQLLSLFFAFPHLYWNLEKGKIFVKIDKSEEKAESVEKLLSSDLYPPIHFGIESNSTFFGGLKKVLAINYSISIPSLRAWCKQNDIANRFSQM